MELHRLRYFVAVAETGSFTKASVREGVTQPSLSQQILELEKELNLRLFDRLGRSIVITAAGKEFLPYAQAVLAAVADAEKAARSGSDGELRVGALPTIAPFLFPRIVPKFLKEHGRVHLQLAEDRTDHLLDAILAGTLDVGIMAMPIRDDRLHVERLFSEAMVVALPSKHPLARKTSLRFADIVEEPFLLLDQFHCFGDQVLSLCRGGGKFEPRVACTGEQLGTLLGLVTAGMGISIVPQMAADAEPGKGRIYRSLTRPVPERTICAVWHKHRYRPPAVRTFVKLLTESQTSTKMP